MIRVATQKDIPKIIELMKSEAGYWHSDWRKDVLERAIGSAGGLAFVWEENEQVIAFACVHDLGFRAYLSALVVGSMNRNRGIGKGLIQYIENELVARGCGVLISDVWKDAVGFYKSLGWSEPDVVLLRKRLIKD